jgi:DNA-binding PadR family transcriptional regulator
VPDRFFRARKGGWPDMDVWRDSARDDSWGWAEFLRRSGRGSPFAGDVQDEGFDPESTAERRSMRNERAPDFSDRGPRRRRPIEHGDMRWLILDLIDQRSRHGYDIIRAIEATFEGHYSPSSGVIYPTLSLLEEAGLILGEASNSRKVYRLTETGRAEIEANRATIAVVRERIDAARVMMQGPSGELMEALGGLRTAIVKRLDADGWSKDSLARISGLLGATASKIGERQ